MEIPKCEDNEGLVQEEHCWHPGSAAAQAPMSQRCCHCGLGFAVRQAPFLADREHGKHGRHRVSQSYQLVFDAKYQDMYKNDPETFEKLADALDESRKSWHELQKKKRKF